MTGRCSPWLALSVASLLGLAACGGSFSSGGNEGGGASGGSGGGSAGSGGGATGRKDCVLNGKTYADGSTFSNGCNSCSCSDGEVSCDARACDDGCTYAGKRYALGESFPAGDGCNKCSCEEGGTVSCTLIGCPSCEDVQATYEEAVLVARKCDPKDTDPCQGKLADGLRCSCEVFVNESNKESLASAKAAAALYASGDCGVGDVLCGACATPVVGYCSPAGLCETLWQEGPTACKVGGVVYPSGATGIPDPTSCNQCSCDNGQLRCTEIGCSKPCPTGRVPSTQCAACGPTDGCLIVEHACLPTCSPDANDCKQGSCVEGVCRNICG